MRLEPIRNPGLDLFLPAGRGKSIAVCDEGTITKNKPSDV